MMRHSKHGRPIVRRALRLAWMAVAVHAATAQAESFECLMEPMVVARIGSPVQGVIDQVLAGLNGRNGIWQQCASVGQNLEFHPVGTGIFESSQDFTAESRDANGVFGIETTRGVGQDRVAFQIDEFQNIATGRIDQSLAPHCGGDHI